MTEVVWAICGLLLGGSGSMLLLKARHERALSLLIQEKQALLIEQATAQQSLKGIQTQLDEMKVRELKIQEEFKTVQQQLQEELQVKASVMAELETLKNQSQEWKDSLWTQWHEQFEAFLLKNLDVAKTNFEEKANQEYQEKQTGFEQKMQELLKPFKEMVENYKKEVIEVREQNLVNVASIKDQILSLTSASNKLALTLSHNKGVGDWGELELIRLLEESGLKEGFHYVKQEALGGSDRRRPDVKIHFPNNRFIFVDAKALQVDVKDYFLSSDPQEEGERQKRLAQSLRQAVKDLSGKEYHAQLEGSPDFVVLYVPRESMLSSALESDYTLFEEAYQRKVILSGPLNLVGLLKIVWLGWTQAELSENAKEILDLGSDLYRKAALFMERFQTVGKRIEDAAKDYNSALTAFDGRQGFIRQIEKLERFGCNKSGKSFPKEPKLIEQLPNPLTLPLEDFITASEDTSIPSEDDRLQSV